MKQVAPAAILILGIVIGALIADAAKVAADPICRPAKVLA